jgi:hypothetical protein
MDIHEIPFCVHFTHTVQRMRKNGCEHQGTNHDNFFKTFTCSGILIEYDLCVCVYICSCICAYIYVCVCVWKFFIKESVDTSE